MRLNATSPALLDVEYHWEMVLPMFSMPYGNINFLLMKSYLVV